jgi:Rrf2 family iron-sulfur cluster assembly transcriptional regulator
VPPAFLSKVLRKLVAAGLLRAERGHHGGFELARPAASIRFLDVWEAIGLELLDEECAFGWGSCNAAKPCPLHDTWTELKHQLVAWAARHTLAELDCGPPPAL